MKNGVYQIRNVLNGKCYIGSCAEYRGISQRWSAHRSALNSNRHYARHLQNAWNKYSADVFVFEVLLYCDPENCLMYEQTALDYYQPEYNTLKIAGSPLGRKHTDATIQKLKDRKFTQQHRDRIGEANRLRVFSQDTIEKMRVNNTGERNPFYGRTHSIKTCEFLRKIKKGMHLGVKNPCAKLTEKDVKNIKSLLQRHISRRQISQQFAISLTTISDIATGKRWSHI